MKFIDILSYKCARYMAEKLNDSHQKRRIYYYGFQIVIGGIIKFILLVLSTLVLGIFLPTFTVLLFFGVLRVMGGGYHMDSYLRCMLTSFGMFMLLGFLVKYTYMIWSIPVLATLSAAAFLLALAVAIKWAPADTPNNPIRSPKKRAKLKTLSIVAVCLWAAADAVLIAILPAGCRFLDMGLNFYVLAGCLGMLMAAFIISPAGYRFFDFISGIGRKRELHRMEA